jgi:hypothetical protein
MAIGVLAVLVIVAAAVFWPNRGVMSQSPQAAAFTTTFAAVLFLGTGLIGFGLQKGPALLSAARWSGGVIWPQVLLGTAFMVAAVFCWRRAIRDAERRISSEPRV